MNIPMKLLFSPFAVLAVLFTLLLGNLALAQSRPAFLQKCPYDIATWPLPFSNTFTCPPAFRPPGLGTQLPCPAGYQYKPQQDCCGALPICDRIVTVYSVGDPRGNLTGFNASICGAGCKPNEWPAQGNNVAGGQSCFIYNSEQQVSYYIFEVKPLPDGRGSSDYGADAGWLRFKILPCDVTPNNANCDEPGGGNCNCDTVRTFDFCNDNGLTNIGNTDFDWLLFDISRFPSRRIACSAINLQPGAGAAPIASANWCGYTGPTGMFDQGLIPCPLAGNTARYSKIIPVTVGQRFILGINCFTNNNVKGYKLDFGGDCQQDNVLFPTANITSIPSGTAIDTVQSDTNYCGVGNFTFTLTNAFPIDSVSQPRKFKVKNLSNRNQKTTVNFISSEDQFDSKRYQINFTPATPGRYQLVYRDTIYSQCGNRYIADSIFFTIKPFILAKKDDDTVHCAEASKPIKIRAVFDTLRGFKTSDHPERIARYKWKLLSYASSGNVVNDSISPGYQYGTLKINSASGSIGGGTPQQIRNRWSQVGSLSIVDTATEANGFTGKLRHRIRCYVTMPVDNSLTNILGTGCIDSVDFTVEFKVMPSAKVTLADSACVFSEPASLSLSTKNNRPISWFTVASEGDFRPLEVVATTPTFVSKYKAGTTYYRAMITDTADGIVCSSIWPNIGQPASRIMNAQYVLPRFSWVVLGNGVTQFPVTIKYTNKSVLISGTDTLPLPASGINYLWNFGFGKAPLLTQKPDENLEILYDSIPTEADSLAFSASLSAFDDISAGLGITACTPVQLKNIVIRAPQFPNVITPNDGFPENDFLKLKVRNNTMKLEIYNRWGNLVYVNNSYDDSWAADGLEGGLYYYLATDKESNATYKGWVQVIK